MVNEKCAHCGREIGMSSRGWLHVGGSEVCFVAEPAHVSQLRLTRYGFAFGDAIVERLIYHKGYVSIRVRSAKSGKYVDVQLSPCGRTFHVSEVKRWPKKK